MDEWNCPNCGDRWTQPYQVDTDPPNEYTTDDNGCRYKWNEDEGVYIPCDDPSIDSSTCDNCSEN